MCIGPFAQKPAAVQPVAPPPEPEVLAEVERGQRAVKPAKKKVKRTLRSVTRKPGAGVSTAGSEGGTSIA